MSRDTSYMKNATNRQISERNIPSIHFLKTTVFRAYFSHLTATELCPEGVTDDPIFRRTTIERIGIQGWDALADRLNEREQVLCIVNSRKNAQQVFERFEGEGCFHLSTLMTPKHRRAVLKEIRECLKNKRPCRVVSTSLIEAGVDVDFPFVFREEAGLDAMLQAAGRCNREGKNSAEESKVYLFQSEGPAQTETLKPKFIIAGHR